jgi:hypothetical protein
MGPKFSKSLLGSNKVELQLQQHKRVALCIAALAVLTLCTVRALWFNAVYAITIDWAEMAAS